MEILSTLKGIQQGKVKDTFGWNSNVEEVDAKKYSSGETNRVNGVNGKAVDGLP